VGPLDKDEVSLGLLVGPAGGQAARRRSVPRAAVPSALGTGQAARRHEQRQGPSSLRELPTDGIVAAVCALRSGMMVTRFVVV